MEIMAKFFFRVRPSVGLALLLPWVCGPAQSFSQTAQTDRKAPADPCGIIAQPPEEPGSYRKFMQDGLDAMHGNPEVAVNHFRAACRACDFGDRHLDLWLSAGINLSDSLAAANRKKEAIAVAHELRMTLQADRLLMSLKGPVVYSQEGKVLCLAGQREEALQLFRDAIADKSMVRDVRSPFYRKMLSEYGAVLSIMGKHEEAEPIYRQVADEFARVREIKPEEETEYIHTHYMLATCLSMLHRPAEGEAPMLKAIDCVLSHKPFTQKDEQQFESYVKAYATLLHNAQLPSAEIRKRLQAVVEKMGPGRNSTPDAVAVER